jgi:exopolyphosphatase/guanosine-5'-triphosphate,3'-diphosphate pyrophosphatase
LGYPIEIISGTEEARLIYIGVSQFLPNDGERRLVIDVGGRSTEMILGQNREPSIMNSYRVGSVSWSQKYFPQGQFTEQAFNQAKVAAQAVLEEALVMYPRDLWDKAYGASGTVGAVADVLQLAGWTPGQITRDGLAWLIQCVQAAQHFSRLRLEGLKEDRRAVIGGGLAVLAALFEQFDIEALHVAQGALRHGAMHELMERDHSEKDVRDASVHRLAEKFGVDRDQAKRVTDVALQLLAMMNPADNQAPHRIERKLAWACELHEIGLAISHSDHHKHGAYILDNADVMGFSQPELHRLSLLVLGHHGKLRKLDMDFEDPMVVQQLLALRLSVILCHSRRQPDMTGLQVHCEPEQKVFEWVCPSDWSQRFPQSHHLIQQEIVAWQKTPWTLRLRNNKVSP